MTTYIPLSAIAKDRIPALLAGGLVKHCQTYRTGPRYLDISPMRYVVVRKADGKRIPVLGHLPSWPIATELDAEYGLQLHARLFSHDPQDYEICPINDVIDLIPLERLFVPGWAILEISGRST